MKKYLLLIISMVCAVTGAWAQTPFYNGASSTWEIDGSTIILRINASGEISTAVDQDHWNYGYNNQLPSEIATAKQNHYTTLRIICASEISLSENDEQGLAVFGTIGTEYQVLDLSKASVTLTDALCKLGGMADNCNIIVPSAYSSNPASFPATTQYGSQAISANKYSVSGTTINASLMATSNITNLSNISSAATTLKVLNDIAGAVDFFTVASGITTFDLKAVTTPNNNNNTITVPSNATVLCASQDVANRISGGTTQVVFNGIATIENNTAGQLQTALETLFDTFTPTAQASDITSLTITGTLNDADLTYISSLSGMTTLDLSGVTSTISTLTSSSLVNLTLPSNATALPTNLATDCPNVPLAYIKTLDGSNNVTKFEAYLNGGSLSTAISSISSNNLASNCVAKINGTITPDDITAINTKFASCYELDFSEATGITASDITGTHQIIKLPANSAMPTDSQASAWNSASGWGTMIVYSLSSDGQTLSVWSNYAVNGNGTTGLYSVVTSDNVNNKVGDYTGVKYVRIVGRNTSSPFANDFTTTITALAAKNIGIAKDAIEYSDCKVTINLASRGTKTMSELISEAETELAKSSKTICTLIVTGEITTTDLESLDDAETATRIDLSEATLATGASVDNIQVPTTLLSLVLPPNNTVSSTLENELAKATYFEYVYSKTSNNGATVPTYVWIAKTGVMAHVFQNESSLTSAVYLKVAAKSGVSLDQNSVDLSNTNMNSLQFLDVSESGLTTAAAPYYKAPHYNPYRIILPNNWSGDDMATFAANKNVGAIAAVYSYHGTTLKIMEINDASYSQAALADPRIMRSGTTEVDVVSGYYDGTTYAQFGTNLLAALNNMGKSEFSVTTKDANNNDVVTNYTNNTLGQSVKTISIETTSAAPNALTFDNPSITTLKAENLVQNNAELNVSACSALTSLSVKGSNLNSVTASGNTSITSADLSGTAIATTTNFNGATALATFTTTSESIFNGNVDLTRSALTGFTSEARFGGNINFNASSSLASIDLSGATFSNNASVIHVDETEGESNTIISGLQKADGIKVPSSFEGTANTRIHPYDGNYVNVASSTAAEYKEEASDMTFHDKTTGDNYRYWYQGTSDNDGIVTIGTSSERRISAIITNHGTLSSDTHAKIKVVGPLTSADITSLKNLNCIALDLSEATYGGSTEGETIGTLLKASFSDTETLGVHSNVKFIALPDSCTRDFILNESALAGLKNSVYCVIAVNETSDGKDLTSYSFQSGSLQPAVVAFQNSAANSWTKILSTETTPTTKYTSTVSNFKKLKISGLINSYDLSKANQKLDADGHLSWAEDVVESTDQTRTLNGTYNVYGPFSSCFLLTEIDLRDAYFEPKSTGEDTSVYFRYWYSDMTLSFLDIISTATYKVVIPQNSKVREIPADFMRCSTNIRAICIPSNIQAIRTRAFYTIDYVWTTADAYATTTSTADPEGNNTRLDNGAKLSDGTQVNALRYNTEKLKYEENPEFHNSYYTADYSGVDGGGTYTFGSTLKLIETGAFANTQPNVSDVYVLNTTAPECHVDAFNTVMYTGNGGYNSAKVSSEGIITRDAYYNGRWITMLHYPRQTTDPQIQRYTDPTRDYSIATGMRDGKGAILYFPNQSEFIRAYQQGTFGYTWNAWNPTRVNGGVDNGDFNGSTNEWTAELQATANDLYNTYKTAIDAKATKSSVENNHQYYSFYDTSLGNNTKPTDLVEYYNVNWSGSAYSEGNPGNLYPRSEVKANNDDDNSGEKTTKDYRGWHQFTLNAYAANTVLDEEPYRSYITDNEWWTICPEFNITKKEAIILFGTPEGYAGATEDKLPYVSKLRYVRRMYGENGNNSIFLNFSDNLMVKKENRSNPTDQHGVLDGNGVMTTDGTTGDEDVVMSAGVPYMIKPNLTVAEGSSSYNRQFRVLTSTDYAKLTQEQKEGSNPRYIESNELYNKIKNAQSMSGTDQRDLIKTGTYTVPVFVGGRDNAIKKGYTVEEVEIDGSNAKTYKVGEVEGYNKSTYWHYTFVGTFYKSFLPHYSYFLGWDSSNKCAKFYYHNGNFDAIDNEMRWANGTGVIVPVKSEDLDSYGKFDHSVSEAKNMETPAQWNLKEAFGDDSFTTTGNSPRMFSMDFNSPDVTSTDNGTTMIEGINVNEDAYGATGNVYSLEGRKVGNSLLGLPKGVYIMNGKKYVVK